MIYKFELINEPLNLKLLFLLHRVNLKEPSFDFIIHLPRLEFKGKYDMNVRVVLVDLAGKGDIVGVLGKDSINTT